ncbi:MAG: hypothetical protein ACRD25_00465 [Terracidiphilus sp.]
MLILENAIYSVIPPEGAAAIMWRDISRMLRAMASAWPRSSAPMPG